MSMFLIAKMLIHLDLQTGLEHLFGELTQQPIRPNQINTISAGPIHQLLRNRRINLRRQLQLGTIFLRCHNSTIIVCHHLTFQPNHQVQRFRPNQLHRGSDSPSRDG